MGDNPAEEKRAPEVVNSKETKAKEKSSPLGKVLGTYKGTRVHQKQVAAILKRFAGKACKLTEVSRFKWPEDTGITSEALAANVVRYMADEGIVKADRGQKNKRSPKGAIIGLTFPTAK